MYERLITKDATFVVHYQFAQLFTYHTTDIEHRTQDYYSDPKIRIKNLEQLLGEDPNQFLQLMAEDACLNSSDKYRWVKTFLEGKYWTVGLRRIEQLFNPDIEKIQHPAALNLIGDFYLQEENIPQAIQYFKRIKDITLLSGKACEEMTFCLYSAKKCISSFKKAQPYFKEALKKLKGEALSHCKLVYRNALKLALMGHQEMDNMEPEISDDEISNLEQAYQTAPLTKFITQHRLDDLTFWEMQVRWENGVWVTDESNTPFKIPRLIAQMREIIYSDKTNDEKLIALHAIGNHTENKFSFWKTLQQTAYTIACCNDAAKLTTDIKSNDGKITLTL